MKKSVYEQLLAESLQFPAHPHEATVTEIYKNSQS